MRLTFKHIFLLLWVLFCSSFLGPLPAFSQANQLQRIKLNWNSFIKVKKSALPYIAYTTHKTMYRYRARQTGNKISLKFEVAVMLDTPKTMVNIDKLKNLDKSAQKDLLNHEQGHTDLAVIYGRELYRQLSNKTYSLYDYQEKTRNIYKKLMEELAAMNFKYDTETEHGDEAGQQDKWDLYIKKRLEL